MGNPKHIIVFVALLATTLLIVVSSSSAAPISSQSLGVNVTPGVTDMSLATSSGVALARIQVIQGTNADPIVAWAAGAHLRLFPVLGLGAQLMPPAASTAMALYVSSFAKRYGPGGTFWLQNPRLPYLPVESYEIGNEANIPLQYVQDATHLHWPLANGRPNASAYAHVYEAARTALHRVDPSGVAVVGGLADSGTPGVSLVDDEQWLSALPRGQVDAVGFHPYTFPVSFSQMYSDTEGLRQWMNTNGMQGAPIDIDEVGACDVLPQDTIGTSGCSPSIPSGDWGAFIATFTQWALCSSQLNVASVQPEYWGDLANTDTNATLSLVSSKGTLTPYGRDYLGETRWLTTKGCALLGASHVHAHGHLVTVSVRAAPASGRLTAVARKGRRRVRLHLTHRGRASTVQRFRAKLAAGRWKVIVMSTPPSSYVSPQSQRLRVTVRR